VCPFVVVGDEVAEDEEEIASFSVTKGTCS